MTVIIFYTVAFGLNLLIFFNFICRKEYQSELNFFIALALLFRSYGQLMIAGAKTLDMALFANEIFYFGGAFLPAFMFLAVARLGKIELPRFVELILLAYSFMIMMFVLSIGKSDIYYSEVYLVRHEEGYATLGKEYGPAHVLYTIMLMGYVVGFIFLFIRVYRNKNVVSKRVVSLSSYLAIIVIFLYLLDRLVHFPISLTSVAYLIASLLCIKIMSDAEMHDLNGCILEAMNGKETSGVVVFDQKENFINANEKAKEIYPQIKKLRVGKKVPDSAGDFYRHVAQRIWELRYGIYNPENSEVVTVGDRKYEIYLNDIALRNGNAPVGTFIEIEDVTVRENIAEMEAQYGKELEEDVKKKENEIRDMQNRLVLGLATVVESRDSSTGEHIVRTQNGVKILTERLKTAECIKLSPEYLDAVTLATPMHDLGKIAIDDRILKEKNKTREQEELIIRLHTEEGAKTVRKVLAGISGMEKGSKFTDIAVNIANFHHERWNGSGAPFGLKGKEIPTEARIVAYIDSLDYYLGGEDGREILPFDKAFDEIVNGIGILFDPEIGVEFVKCRNELKEMYSEGVHAQE
jgi:HD-GYP domain-containing protein (c-di-GMP phosphodiesterase class II)